MPTVVLVYFVLEELGYSQSHLLEHVVESIELIRGGLKLAWGTIAEAIPSQVCRILKHTQVFLKLGF